MLLSARQRQAYRTFLLWNSAYAFLFTLIATVNLIYQFKTAHLTPLQLVLVGTVLEAVCFLAQIPTGVLADVFSRRLAIVLGTLLVGLGFTIEGLFPYFGVILLTQLIWGLGATLFDGADGAWLATEMGEAHLETAYLRSGQWGQAATLLAIPLSIGLASIRLNIPIVTGGVLLMGLAGVLVFVMQEHAFVPSPPDQRPTWHVLRNTLRQGLRAVRLSHVLGWYLAIELIFGLASEGWDRLWQPYFLTNFTLPRIDHLQPIAWIGIAEMGAAVLGIITTQVFQRFLPRTPRLQSVGALIVLHAIRLLAVLLFGLAGNVWWALAAFWLVDSMRHLNRPLLQSRLTRSIPAEVRATVLSLNGQVNALGQIAGGPAVGAVGNRSLRAAMMAVSVLLTPILGLWVGVKRGENPKE